MSTLKYLDRVKPEDRYHYLAKYIHSPKYRYDGRFPELYSKPKIYRSKCPHGCRSNCLHGDENSIGKSSKPKENYVIRKITINQTPLERHWKYNHCPTFDHDYLNDYKTMESPK